MTDRKPPLWTPEKVGKLSKKDIKTLKENAAKRGDTETVRTCDDLLQSTITAKAPASKQRQQNIGDFVAGYHFVCERERGVSHMDGGRFWSGSWVVAEKEVRLSLQYGAYLALHEIKAEISYIQGQIIDFRRAPRDMIAKQNEGIEFLVVESATPYHWVGAGAGEKGYLWEKIVSVGKSEINSTEEFGK